MTIQELVVQNEHGLHMRVASEIVKLAQEHDAIVHIQREGHPSADACSMMELLKLGATEGTHVKVHADGPEKEAVIDALKGLFEHGAGI